MLRLQAGKIRITNELFFIFSSLNIKILVWYLGQPNAKSPLLPPGFNVGRSAGGRSTLREINRDACHFSGFPVLQALLPKHTNVPEIYFLLMALFLQQPVTEMPDSLQAQVSTALHSATIFVCPQF